MVSGIAFTAVGSMDVEWCTVQMFVLHNHFLEIFLTLLILAKIFVTFDAEKEEAADAGCRVR